MKPEDKIQYKISINEMLFKSIELGYKGFVTGEQQKYLQIMQTSLADTLAQLDKSDDDRRVFLSNVTDDGETLDINERYQMAIKYRFEDDPEDMVREYAYNPTWDENLEAWCLIPADTFPGKSIILI